MNVKKNIPNFLTLGNLLCGTIATIFAVQSNFIYAAIFVLIGILFDFLDGFVARLFNVSGELGKQLDSLADMVTSGVVPGIIMMKLIQVNLIKEPIIFNHELPIFDIHIIGLLLTLGACYRLGKFNIDTRQSDSFIGLPTPAMCLFVISLPMIMEYSNFDLAKELLLNNYFLIVTTFVLTYLMNAEIALFSLKFKDYSLKNNWLIYLFLIISLLLIIVLKYISIPFIITLYIGVSIIKNVKAKI